MFSDIEKNNPFFLIETLHHQKKLFDTITLSLQKGTTHLEVCFATVQLTQLIDSFISIIEKWMHFDTKINIYIRDDYSLLVHTGRLGIIGDIYDFNNRVQPIHDRYPGYVKGGSKYVDTRVTMAVNNIKLATKVDLLEYII